MRKALVLSTSVCALAGTLAAAGLAGPASAARAGAGTPAANAVPGGVISTVAGGVGGPGRATSVAINPCGVRWTGGWLYIGEGAMVRRVSMATDGLTTVTGDNAAGPLDGSGTAAASPVGGCSPTLDRAGNLVIPAGEQVLVVATRTGTFYGQAMTAGHTYTIAGAGGSRGGVGPDGDGGPATSAILNNADDVAFDQAGNLLIADSGSDALDSGDCAVGSLVRVVAATTGTFYGQAMTAGDIYTVGGTQSSGCGPGGGGTGSATSAWLGALIGSVRQDRDGNLVVTELGQPGLVNESGATPPPPWVQVIAKVTGTFYGIKMKAGDIYTVAGNGQTGSGGDGGRATSAQLDGAFNAVPTAVGNLVIADNSRVRVVAARTGRFYGQQMTADHIYGIAGTGRAGYSGDSGLAVKAQVSAGSVTVDAAGNVLLAGSDRVRVVADRTGTFYGIKMTAGDIYTVAGNGTTFSGDGGLPLRAEITYPVGVSVDGAGDIAVTATAVFVSSTFIPGDLVDTTVDLIASRSGTFFGRPLTAGRLYRVAGNGIPGFRGDQGPARNAEFCVNGANVFDYPGVPTNGAALAFDGRGDLLVADGCNNRVRLIAVRSGRFFGQAMTAGDVYTIAGTGTSGFSGDGGPAVTEKLNDPTGTGVDHHGNVLIADTQNNRVRVIAAATGTFYGQKMTAGRIYTIAGASAAGFSGDGGPAVKARLAGPVAVAADRHGNVLIADQGNDRVRVIAAATGTFYGQKMTGGRIYTIAGPAGFSSLDGVTTDRHGNVIFTDSAGAVWVAATTDGTFYGQAMTAGGIYKVAGGGATLGDGGPATSALLSAVGAVAVSPAGNLLVADGSDNRLRAISP
jgi:hypothetical protein